MQIDFALPLLLIYGLKNNTLTVHTFYTRSRSNMLTTATMNTAVASSICSIAATIRNEYQCPLALWSYTKLKHVTLGRDNLENN